MVDVMYSILFRCDGSSEIGFGHIMRCLALADELSSNHKCNIIFAVLRDKKAIKIIQDYGYFVETKDFFKNDFIYGDWINSVIQNHNVKCIILDVRDDLPSEIICIYRERGTLIVTIDDPTDRRLLADLAFYPPAPQVAKMDWKGFTGQLYVGWEWVVLRREFSKDNINHCVINNMTGDVKVPNILITMGGSDPQGMTLKVLKALAFIDNKLEVTVVIGPGFGYQKDLLKLLNHFSHPYRILENVSNMADIMAESNLAVASFGVTAYELAAMQVPTLQICLSEDHVQSALSFQESGMATCLGIAEFLTEEKIAGSLKQALFKKIPCTTFRDKVK
jgi:spore coat polysaccharide biosynthesis protein SpsF